MLDSIMECIPGVSAKARYRASSSLRSFPQIILVESVAQLAGVAALRPEGGGGFIASVDNAVFGPPPGLSDTILLTARIVKSFGRLSLVEGSAESDGKRLLDVTLTIGAGRP